MNEIDILLTDEFVQFSTKIAEIHKSKKKKKEVFKQLYEQFQQEIHTLDTEAQEVATIWGEWRSKNTKEVKDSPAPKEATPAKSKSKGAK